MRERESIKYSVIVPIYNSQKTIAACMYSVLLAMRSDVELLLIDNASTDHSADIIREIESRRDWPSPISYYYEKNSGVSSARNKGIAAARGEYLIFLDSDDELSSDCFDLLENAGNADLLIYQMDFGGRGSRKCLPRRRKGVSGLSFGKRIVALLHTGLLHSASNKRFKKSVIDRFDLRFVESLNIGEDFLFSLSYSIHCRRIELVDEYLYKVNSDNPNSLSRGYRPNLTEQLTLLYRLQNEMLLGSSLPGSTRRRLLREMDYLHSKAVCSCIAETFKVGFGPYLLKRKQFQRIAKAFDRPLTGADGYCNWIHRGLNWLLAHHIVYPIYLVTTIKKARAYRFYRKGSTCAQP